MGGAASLPQGAPDVQRQSEVVSSARRLEGQEEAQYGAVNPMEASDGLLFVCLFVCLLLLSYSLPMLCWLVTMSLHCNVIGNGRLLSRVTLSVSVTIPNSVPTILMASV